MESIYIIPSSIRNINLLRFYFLFHQQFNGHKLKIYVINFLYNNNNKRLQIQSKSTNWTDAEEAKKTA